MRYKAFGLILESEILLAQASDPAMPEDMSSAADVSVYLSDLSAEFEGAVGGEARVRITNSMRHCFDVPSVGRFRITDGKRIDVHLCEGVPDSLPALYILGSCMGCIFQQRGMFAMHGSCVCKGDMAVLISGNSGAGKSTLAARFIRHGWKLMTDDVAVIRKDNGSFRVVSG